MKLDIKKEEYKKYDSIDIVIKSQKQTIKVTGKVISLKSTADKLSIVTENDRCEIISKEIVLIHFYSSIKQNIVQNIDKYLDMDGN